MSVDILEKENIQNLITFTTNLPVAPNADENVVDDVAEQWFVYEVAWNDVRWDYMLEQMVVKRHYELDTAAANVELLELYY